MIIQTAISLEEKKKAIATKNHFLLADKREQDEDKKLLASWGGTKEEAEANQEKVRELIREVYR